MPHCLGGVGQGGRPGADGALAGYVQRGERAGAEVRFALVQRGGPDQAGVPVVVAFGLLGEAGQRGELLLVPGDEERADGFDGDAGLGSVGGQQAGALADQACLQGAGHRVEAGVQDRGVGLGGALSDVVLRLDEGDAQTGVAGEGAGDRTADDSGADDGHVVRDRWQRSSVGDRHAGVPSSSAVTAARKRPRRSAASSGDTRGSYTAAGLPVRQRVSEAQAGFRAEPGQRAHPECGRIRQRGHLDGALQQVGLGLHEQGRAGQAAVDAEDFERVAEVRRGGVRQRHHLGGQPLAERAHQVPGPGVQAQSGEGPAQVAAPPGGGEPGEGRYEGDAAAVGHGPAHGVEVGGAPDDAEVGEPADGGGGRVHLAVEAVAGVSAEPPGDTADQSGGTAPGRVAGVGEEERARAVSALGAAGCGDALSEQGGLLVDDQPGERNRRHPGAEGGGRTDEARVVHDVRQSLVGQAVDLQCARRPLGAVEVQELCTAERWRRP